MITPQLGSGQEDFKARSLRHFDPEQTQVEIRRPADNYAVFALYRNDTMQIHQFQVSYLAEQDRILVRMNSTEGEEQQLWLTRRMLRGLYPHLEQTFRQLTLGATSNLGHDGAAGNAVQAFQRQEVLNRADFDTPFQSAASPLDDADLPLLVTTTHIHKQNDSMVSVRFEENLQGHAENRQLEIQMGSDTLLGLLHVIRLALQTSDWDLNTVPAPAPTIVIDSDGQDSDWGAFALAEPPKYLN